MNAQGITLNLHETQDELEKLLTRMRRLSSTICGPTPSIPQPPDELNKKDAFTPNFLDECATINLRTQHVIRELGNEIDWLESFFLPDGPTESTPVRAGGYR